MTFLGIEPRAFESCFGGEWNIRLCSAVTPVSPVIESMTLVTIRRARKDVGGSFQANGSVASDLLNTRDTLSFFASITVPINPWEVQLDPSKSVSTLNRVMELSYDDFEGVSIVNEAMVVLEDFDEKKITHSVM